MNSNICQLCWLLQKCKFKILFEDFSHLAGILQTEEVRGWKLQTEKYQCQHDRHWLGLHLESIHHELQILLWGVQCPEYPIKNVPQGARTDQICKSRRDCNMSSFLKLQFLETSWEWNINITTELLFTFRIWGGGHVVHGWSWWRWKTGHQERNLRGHASYIMWMWLNMEECSIIDEEVHDEFISDKKSSVFETMIQLWLLIFKLLRYLSTK